MIKRLSLSAVALALAAAVAALPALAATPRNTLIPRTIGTSNAPVAGAPELTGSARARLLFPGHWRLTRQTKSTLTFREGGVGCQYTVRATVRIATGDEADAAAHAAAALPASGRLLLESGIRNSSAWRVIREQERGFTHLEAIAVIPLRFASQNAARKVWGETLISGRSGVGDECHSGTYRDTLGPAMGDALATQRASAFVSAPS